MDCNRDRAPNRKGKKGEQKHASDHKETARLIGRFEDSGMDAREYCTMAPGLKMTKSAKTPKTDQTAAESQTKICS